MNWVNLKIELGGIFGRVLTPEEAMDMKPMQIINPEKNLDWTTKLREYFTQRLIDKGLIDGRPALGWVEEAWYKQAFAMKAVLKVDSGIEIRAEVNSDGTANVDNWEAFRERYASYQKKQNKANFINAKNLEELIDVYSEEILDENDKELEANRKKFLEPVKEKESPDYFYE